MKTTMTAPSYRAFHFGVTRGVHEPRGEVSYLRAEAPLQAYPARMTDRLQHWAQTAPERTWMAQRGADGQWVRVSYAQAWERAQRLGQALLDAGLSVERPLAILSENSLEHALLALGAMTVGVPYCAVSTAYSLISQDFEKLRHVLNTLTPGMVYASDWDRYGKAIGATVSGDTVVVVNQPTQGATFAGAVWAFDELLQTTVTPRVAAAIHATGPDTIVKFLFTSGSTKLPKAVINTQRMICANQQQIRQSMPSAYGDGEPPVLVDWLPWNHTFGGNNNVHAALFNGGSFYIDEGKPTPALIGKTLVNLREIAPTAYYNVPIGFELIAAAMKTDDLLRKNLLSQVRMFFYAGAALAQPVWDSLFESQERETGQRIVMGTGLGMTESAPHGLFVTNANVKAGDLGLPSPGMLLKLVPAGDKIEVRYKGPNITPGYWRNPEASAEAFDEEGYLCTGDAVKWIDEQDIHQGLKFDGRTAEDFKLSTGTFVSVGPLRAKIIAAGAPYVQDAVITGLNLKEVGALIFPTGAVRTLSGLAPEAALSDVLNSPAVQAHFQNVVNMLAASSTGSATRIARLHVMDQPPSIDLGEVTDKGSINQRAVLKHRETLVNALHERVVGNIGHIVKPKIS
jgi:feruloyl-CoA synthase